MALGGCLLMRVGMLGSASTDKLTLRTGGTSAAVTIDSSQRVGIGTSSPAQKLEIQDGSISIGSSSNVNATNVLVAGYGYILSGTKYGNTSIRSTYSNSTNAASLEFYVASLSTSTAEAMRITSAGLVGIGTSAPASKLVVSNAGAEGWELGSTSGTVELLGYNRSTSARSPMKVIGQTFLVQTGNPSLADGLYQDSSGRVGIGTNSPVTALDVRGEVSVDYNASYGLRFYNQNRSNWSSIGNQIATGSTQANLVFKSGQGVMTYDNTGRLLIGTSSSSYPALLQVSGNTTNASGHGILQLRRGNNATTAGDDLGAIWFGDGLGGNRATIEAMADAAGGTNDLPSRLVFSTTADGASSPTERCRITSDGRFGVNATNLANGRLIVESDGTAITPFVIRDTAAGTSSVNSVGFFRNATLVGSIALTGSATAYNTSSDYRLKENVVAVPDGITRLQQLKPSRFNFIVDPDTVVDGFIAHEVQAIVPEAITGEKDAVDDDNNPVYQGIDQSKLVPLLTAALQELVAEVEFLKAEVSALKGA
jgi:hypothetical protein